MTSSASACQVRSATRDDVPLLIELMAEFYAESNFPLPVVNARRARSSGYCRIRGSVASGSRRRTRAQPAT